MPRILTITCAAALAVALCAACGESPAAPSPPTIPDAPSISGAAPIVRLAVTIDETGARDAIAGVSDVTVDASASSGSTGALAYAVDFGDGSIGSGVVARHVYSRKGVFPITVEARDSAGRTATASATVIVRSLDEGSWFHAGYIDRTQRVEVRHLTITGQEGTAVRGVYRATSDRDRTFIGTLTRPRTLQITLDNGVTLTGTLPGRLYEEGSSWAVQSAGDPATPTRFEFRPIPLDSADEAPDANLRVRIDSYGSSLAVVGVSPVEFDGTHSRGSGLSYFIEFGDGQYSTEGRITHRVGGAGNALSRIARRTARLTVIDRFGRTDSESLEYSSLEFGRNDNAIYDFWIINNHAGSLSFQFAAPTGATYPGHVRSRTLSPSDPFNSYPAVATISGERDIRIAVPGWNVEFRGYLDLSKAWFPELVLTQIGGVGDGTKWSLFYNSGP